MGTGKEQALAYDVVVDGVAGFFFEFAHHVVLAEIVFPGKGFDGEVFGQIVVDVAEKLFNLGVAAVGAGVVDVLLLQENAVSHKTMNWVKRAVPRRSLPNFSSFRAASSS